MEGPLLVVWRLLASLTGVGKSFSETATCVFALALQQATAVMPK